MKEYFYHYQDGLHSGYGILEAENLKSAIKALKDYIKSTFISRKYSKNLSIAIEELLD